MDGTPSGDWWLVVDLQAGVQAGSGWEFTLEHAIVLAASLADRGLRQGYGVGLATCGEPPTWLAPQQGEQHRWQILRALALLEPGELPLAKLLSSQRRSFGRGASLIVITPDVSGAWIEALLPLMWAGASPTVLLLDAATFGGQGDPAAALSLLDQAGIRRHLVPRQYLDRPELSAAAHPGQEGQWEWRTLATGRAVLVRRPGNLTWRTLE